MTSRLEQMQARFQQRQLQEKEEKLLRLYENQQQRVFDRVSRNSAGSNNSMGSNGGGKVRQMFDERRQKAGIDKSYPLEPLTSSANRGGSVDRLKNNRLPANNKQITNKTSVRRTVAVNNGNSKPVIKKESFTSVYNNNNGDETYKQRYYIDDNVSNSKYSSNSSNGLVELMNKHNLNSNLLDDEESPQFDSDVDEVDVTASYLTRKPANLGGKLPSQNVQSAPKNTVSYSNSLRTSNNTRSPDKKPLTKSVSSCNKNALPKGTHFQLSKTESSPLSLPEKQSKEMSKPAAKAFSGKASSASSLHSKTGTSGRTNPRQSNSNAVARDDLVQCKYCDRRFASDRVGTHQEVCARTSKKKRKAYDALKHRVGGTEMEGYIRKQSAKSTKSTKGASGHVVKNNWRQTHAEFVANIRAAKMAQAHVAKGGKLSDLPPPPPSSNPDFVQCPHCGRRFNESAAERHIPKCATYEFNKPKGKAATKR